MNNLMQDEEVFYERLHQLLKPSAPIDTIEHLWGREEQLNEIKRALYAHGRHAFILGDRGVGKSSLAQTTAYAIQSSDNTPVIVTCDHQSTLSSIILKALKAAINSVDFREHATKLQLKLPFLTYELSSSVSKKPTFPESIDIQDAAFALINLSDWHSTKPVIVIDEFDLMPDEERRNFGVLLKQLGDQHAKVKLIFTGIGQSLDSLMSGHLSSFRQLHQVKLDVLDWSARFKIIETAFDAFDVSLPEEIKYKIAGLSDGFPSYIHLICEKLLTRAYFSRDEIDQITFPLFIQALDDAINSVTETLRKSYDKATDGKPEHMHHILWAMADSSDLQRKTDHITYSYEAIANQLRIPSLEAKAFKREFDKLRNSSHGEIIKRAFDNRPGWFAFSENVIRGFIRMCAEKNKVELDFERAFSPITATARPTGPRSNYQPLNQVERDADHMRKKY